MSRWDTLDREIQLDLTPEIEELYMLFKRCQTKNRKRSIKQHIKYFDFRSLVQLGTLYNPFQPGGGVSQATLKNYCWMYSTFNIPEDFEGNCARSTGSDAPVYNTYYQWVPIFLIFQVMIHC